MDCDQESNGLRKYCTCNNMGINSNSFKTNAFTFDLITLCRIFVLVLKETNWVLLFWRIK